MAWSTELTLVPNFMPGAPEKRKTRLRCGTYSSSAPQRAPGGVPAWVSCAHARVAGLKAHRSPSTVPLVPDEPPKTSSRCPPESHTAACQPRAGGGVVSLGVAQLLPAGSKT